MAKAPAPRNTFRLVIILNRQMCAEVVTLDDVSTSTIPALDRDK
jgi:hypothetical protein